MPMQLGSSFGGAAGAVEYLQALTSTHLPAAQARVLELAREAQNLNDPNLSPEGLEARRKELMDAARTEGERLVQQLAREVERAENVIRFHAEQNNGQPKDSSERLLAEMQTGRAWERTRAMLDAGESLESILETADLDTLRALRAELPAYLASQDKRRGLNRNPHERAAITAESLRAIDRAMVPQLPGEAGKALGYRLTMDDTVPQLRQVLDGIRLTAHGTDSPTHTLTAAYALNEAARASAPAAA